MSNRSDVSNSVNARVNPERADWQRDHVALLYEDHYTPPNIYDTVSRTINMHHARVQSMTSEDQDHNHGYTDESSNEASNPSSPNKRRRVSASWVNVSCQLCKTRKVKCDRTLPSCGWCTRNNAACEYKERKKPGLRAGYGRELEQRLDRLEGVLLRHEELLNRALGSFRGGSEQLSCPGERASAQAILTNPTEAPYTFPSREPEHNAFSRTHNRTESSNGYYTSGQQHRDFAPSLPPINTHDRRLSVTFMNNPTSPPSFQVRPSTSQSPPQRRQGILKHSPASSSSQHPPLPTPDTTTNSNAQSPQPVQDYLTHKSPANNATTSNVQLAEVLKQRYPSNLAFRDYRDERLPPWPIMYELAIQYFTHIHPALPLISEATVFEAILNPHRLRTEASDIRAILIAITIVAMRFLPSTLLTPAQRDQYITQCRARLADPGISRTREGAQALAVLVLSGNSMARDETANVLGVVNERLWQKGTQETKAQSPLSVNEMLCRD